MEDSNAAMKEALDNETFGLNSRMKSLGPKSTYSSRKKAYPLKSVLYPDPNPTFRRGVPTRRLTNDEYKIRREKGLGFKCDKKFIVGHRCLRKELHVLVVCEERDIEIESEETDEEEGI